MAERILIVGAQSQLAQVVAAHFTSGGYECIGLGRKELDLATLNTPWDPAGLNVKAALVFAAVTNIHECERDQAGSYRTNVLGTIRLLEGLGAAGIFSIFLSTNLVFDGQFAFPDEDATLNPQTEYGKQKAQVEGWLLEHAKAFAILRLSKVLHGDKTIFSQWKRQLEQGETVSPFTDLCFSPITASFAAQVLKAIVSSGGQGVFQVSGDEDVSYADACYFLASAMNSRRSQVRPAVSRDLGYPGYVPKFSTLGMKRLEELGFTRPKTQDALQTHIHQLLKTVDDGALPS